MPNNRQKGKRIERWAANELKEFFPDVRRNAMEQSRGGGVDLENTGMFNVEVKGGKSYKSKMIRNILDQVATEGKPQNLDLCMIKPDREAPYIAMPLDDFKELLQMLKSENIL